MASLWSRWTGKAEVSPEVSSDVAIRDISWEEVEKNYNLEFVEDTPGKEFAIVTPKNAERLTTELGTSAPSPWTSFTRQEYNTQLQGLKGLETWDKMRRSDGTVRGTLRTIKTPVLSGRWFMEAGGDSKVDQTATNFVWRNLNEMMSICFSQVLSEALLSLDFGYYMFEKVWEPRIVDGQLRIVLAKLAPRHPMDVREWVFDRNGGPRGAWFFSPDGGLTDDVYIPIEKLLVFTFDREAGDITGISVLRSAYKHWYYKEQLYKIDAIQKERHAIGIPVVMLPIGYKDPEDKRAAENLARNIRTNERAHIVLPPGWQVMMLKLEGHIVDALDSIEHHNEAIRENVLANFIREGARDEDLVMFFKAARIVADIVRDTFNTYLIRQMVDYNFSRAKYPKLKVRRIGETADWRTMSFAVRNLIGSGALIPDEQLEINLRDEMDLPKMDKETSRLIATPQNPFDINDEVQDAVPEDNSGDRTRNNQNPSYRRRPRRSRTVGGGGLPRQTPITRARNSYGLPRSNGGQDRSGG